MAVLPKTGITQTLVKQTLGAGSYGIGVLCTHAGINMFSKYKPVRYSTNNTDSDPNWWKAGGNCGINIPRLNKATDAGTQNWTYERPAGGSGEPFRLGDFRGYNHEAYPILSPGFRERYTVNKITTTKMSLFCLIGGLLENSLYYGDILNPALSELYFSVEIYRSSGVRRASATAGKTIGNYGDIIEIDISTFDSGDYVMYFYLRSSKKLQNDAETASIDYAIYHNSEYINPVPLTITASAPLSFEVLEIGYSLRGTFRSYSDFDGYALQSEGTVAFKIRITGNAGYSDVDFRIKTFNWWGEEVKVYLGSSIYNSSKVKVNSINLQSGVDNIFYIVSNVFSVRGGMQVSSPPERVRIYAFCEFQLVRGNVTNIATLGMASFVAVSGGMGMIIKDPGLSGGLGGDY